MLPLHVKCAASAIGPSADLLEGACVESCPAGMTASGIGDFKRRCMEPFACANGRIQGQDVAFGCKCSTDDMTPAACQMCEFRADEFGQHCTRCNGGMVSCGLLAAHTSTLNVQQCKYLALQITTAGEFEREAAYLKRKHSITPEQLGELESGVPCKRARAGEN